MCMAEFKFVAYEQWISKSTWDILEDWVRKLLGTDKAADYGREGCWSYLRAGKFHPSQAHAHPITDTLSFHHVSDKSTKDNQ